MYYYNVIEDEIKISETSQECTNIFSQQKICLGKLLYRIRTITKHIISNSEINLIPIKGPIRNKSINYQ